ncbi:MAG TPA: hypothetical protein VFO34_17660, partial [Candidatus Acidoferrales bacterium]|nr:hypothetical protein [Candidatus Acidoferrales bacterium]
SGAREFFLLTLRTTEITYRSILWLAADKPKDPDRQPEFALSIPPLSRTILDHLINVIFVLEDIPTRIDWYFKADWREARLELDRLSAEYGADSDWTDHLQKFRKYSDDGIGLLGIKATEAANPRLIPPWPNPGATPNFRVSGNSPLPPSRAFLKYLNDWFYADLSQQAHLSGSGLGKRSGILLTEYRTDPKSEERLIRYKKSQFGQVFSLTLSLITELDLELNLGLRNRIQYLWTTAAPYIAVADEICRKRYAALLGLSPSIQLARAPR